MSNQSLGRASTLLAAGTLISRITGLLRTIVLVSVIGSQASAAADAFGIANQLPNDVFSLISVGILTAVIVPQIVQASRQADRGNAFISKLFTLGTVVLFAATAAAVLAAPFLVSLAADGTPEQMSLATAFAFWCLPQIFFYGLYALVGETLNARRVFGPFAWAPIVNNVISIVGFLAIIWLYGGDLTRVDDWTPVRIAMLGGFSTFGIVAQAAVLMLFWRKTNLRLRPDFRWRGVGLGNIARLAGWTFLMALVSLSAGIIQNRIAYTASGEGASVAVMMNAWLIFMLPYSIIVLSIGTPYFTQISEHAAAARHADVKADIARSIRILGLFLMAALAAILAAAVPATRVFTNSAQDAQDASAVLICFLVALIPLAVLFIVQRTFYAYGDTRTPFFFTLLQASITVTTALIAGALLPMQNLAAGIALGQSLATIVQTLLAIYLLHRRLGGISVLEWSKSLGVFALAAIPAAGIGYLTYLLLGGDTGWTSADKLWGALGAAIIATVTIAVYFVILHIFRVPETRIALSVIGRVIGRPGG